MEIDERGSLLLFEMELRMHALEQRSSSHSVRYDLDEGEKADQAIPIRCRIFSEYAGTEEFGRLTEPEKKEYLGDWIEMEWTYLQEQIARFRQRGLQIQSVVCRFEIMVNAGMSPMVIFSQSKTH
jgi:hypothetical protein